MDVDKGQVAECQVGLMPGVELGGRKATSRERLFTLLCGSTFSSIADLQFLRPFNQNRRQPPFLRAFRPPQIAGRGDCQASIQPILRASQTIKTVSPLILTLAPDQAIPPMTGARNATQFGFVRTVKREVWHWEFLPEKAEAARRRGAHETF